MGAHLALLVVPLLFFGCFTAGDDKDSDDGGDDTQTGCRSDADCRAGRVCIDTTGDLDGLCESDEDCSCGPAGNGGSANGGSSGNGTGGSSEGGTGTGGGANGGSTTGGNGTGGNAMGGSATGGSGTGGSSGDCGAYCDRIVAAMCAATDRNACIADCGSFSAACPAEAPPVIECIADPANQIACMSGVATIQGCDAEIEAMNRCFICAPETGDMQCLACAKTSCCEELGAYNLAPDVEGFFTCLDACTTNECVDGCVTTYPVAGAAALDLVDCQNTTCSEPCICEVTTDDDTCSTCYKQNCCSEYVDYSLSSDIEGFETCAIACTDDPCIEECANSFPVAGTNFATWSACVSTSCATPCQ
jgi:hypothetical protein